MDECERTPCPSPLDTKQVYDKEFNTYRNRFLVVKKRLMVSSMLIAQIKERNDRIALLERDNLRLTADASSARERLLQKLHELGPLESASKERLEKLVKIEEDLKNAQDVREAAAQHNRQLSLLIAEKESDIKKLKSQVEDLKGNIATFKKEQTAAKLEKSSFMKKYMKVVRHAIKLCELLQNEGKLPVYYRGRLLKQWRKEMASKCTSDEGELLEKMLMSPEGVNSLCSQDTGFDSVVSASDEDEPDSFPTDNRKENPVATETSVKKSGLITKQVTNILLKGRKIIENNGQDSDDEKPEHLFLGKKETSDLTESVQIVSEKPSLCLSSNVEAEKLKDKCNERFVSKCASGEISLLSPSPQKKEVIVKPTQPITSLSDILATESDILPEEILPSNPSLNVERDVDKDKLPIISIFDAENTELNSPLSLKSPSACSNDDDLDVIFTSVKVPSPVSTIPTTPRRGLSRSSSIIDFEQKNASTFIAPDTCSVAVGTDTIMPIFCSAETQTEAIRMSPVERTITNIDLCYSQVEKGSGASGTVTNMSLVNSSNKEVQTEPICISSKSHIAFCEKTDQVRVTKYDSGMYRYDYLPPISENSGGLPTSTKASLQEKSENNVSSKKHESLPSDAESVQSVVAKSTSSSSAYAFRSPKLIDCRKSLGNQRAYKHRTVPEVEKWKNVCRNLKSNSRAPFRAREGHQKSRPSFVIDGKRSRKSYKRRKNLLPKKLLASCKRPFMHNFQYREKNAYEDTETDTSQSEISVSVAESLKRQSKWKHPVCLSRVMATLHSSDSDSLYESKNVSVEQLCKWKTRQPLSVLLSKAGVCVRPFTNDAGSTGSASVGERRRMNKWKNNLPLSVSCVASDVEKPVTEKKAFHNKQDPSKWRHCRSLSNALSLLNCNKPYGLLPKLTCVTVVGADGDKFNHSRGSSKQKYLNCFPKAFRSRANLDNYHDKSQSRYEKYKNSKCSNMLLKSQLDESARPTKPSCMKVVHQLHSLFQSNNNKNAELCDSVRILSSDCNLLQSENVDCDRDLLMNCNKNNLAVSENCSLSVSSSHTHVCDHGTKSTTTASQETLANVLKADQIIGRCCTTSQKNSSEIKAGGDAAEGTPIKEGRKKCHPKVFRPGGVNLKRLRMQRAKMSQLARTLEIQALKMKYFKTSLRRNVILYNEVSLSKNARRRVLEGMPVKQNSTLVKHALKQLQAKDVGKETLSDVAEDQGLSLIVQNERAEIQLEGASAIGIQNCNSVSNDVCSAISDAEKSRTEQSLLGREKLATAGSQEGKKMNVQDRQRSSENTVDPKNQPSFTLTESQTSRKQDAVSSVNVLCEKNVSNGSIPNDRMCALNNQRMHLGEYNSSEIKNSFPACDISNADVVGKPEESVDSITRISNGISAHIHGNALNSDHLRLPDKDGPRSVCHKLNDKHVDLDQMNVRENDQTTSSFESGNTAALKAHQSSISGVDVALKQQKPLVLEFPLQRSQSSSTSSKQKINGKCITEVDIGDADLGTGIHSTNSADLTDESNVNPEGGRSCPVDSTKYIFGSDLDSLDSDLDDTYSEKIIKGSCSKDSLLVSINGSLAEKGAQESNYKYFYDHDSQSSPTKVKRKRLVCNTELQSKNDLADKVNEVPQHCFEKRLKVSDNVQNISDDNSTLAHEVKSNVDTAAQFVRSGMRGRKKYLKQLANSENEVVEKEHVAVQDNDNEGNEIPRPVFRRIAHQPKGSSNVRKSPEGSRVKSASLSCVSMGSSKATLQQRLQTGSALDVPFRKKTTIVRPRYTTKRRKCGIFGKTAAQVKQIAQRFHIPKPKSQIQSNEGSKHSKLKSSASVDGNTSQLQDTMQVASGSKNIGAEQSEITSTVPPGRVASQSANVENEDTEGNTSVGLKPSNIASNSLDLPAVQLITKNIESNALEGKSSVVSNKDNSENIAFEENELNIPNTSLENNLAESTEHIAKAGKQNDGNKKENSYPTIQLLGSICESFNRVRTMKRLVESKDSARKNTLLKTGKMEMNVASSIENLKDKGFRKRGREMEEIQVDKDIAVSVDSSKEQEQLQIDSVPMGEKRRKVDNSDDTIPDRCLIDESPKFPEVDICSIDESPKFPEVDICSIDESPKFPEVDICSVDESPKSPDVDICSIDESPKSPDVESPMSPPLYEKVHSVPKVIPTSPLWNLNEVNSTCRPGNISPSISEAETELFISPPMAELINLMPNTITSPRHDVREMPVAYNTESRKQGQNTEKVGEIRASAFLRKEILLKTSIHLASIRKAEGVLQSSFNWFMAERRKEEVRKILEEKRRIRTQEKMLLKSALKQYISRNFDNESLAAVIQDVLRATDTKTIAKYIVKCLSKDEGVLDETCTPPAPPLTSTQQRLLTLVLKLQADHHPYQLLTEQVLVGIEFRISRLGHSPNLTAVSSLTRFFAAVCRIQADKLRVQSFCLMAFYCVKFKSHVVLHTVLVVYPEALPMCYVGEGVLLLDCLVHAVMSQPPNPLPVYKINALKELLHKVYGYSREKFTAASILKAIIDRLKAGTLEHVEPAMVLLAKRQEWEWTQKHIVSAHLQPIIEEWKQGKVSELIAKEAVKLLGYVVKCFPKDGQANIQFVIGLLEKLLLDNDAGSHAFKETVSSSLICLVKHDFDRIVGILMEWKPKQPISSNLRTHMQVVLRGRPITWWQKYLRKRNRV